MRNENGILALSELGYFLREFLEESETSESALNKDFNAVIARSEIENPWFTKENIRFALNSWAEILTQDSIKNWVGKYQENKTPKKVGLILAGNIPMVGFHDVVSTLVSGHEAKIKLSSKDRLLIPFLLKVWNEFSNQQLKYSLVERLEGFDAVVATGSNNTARYLEYYFKDYLNIIRKNRTSVAILSGKETDKELQLLGEDIFRYFGLGCRNVTKLMLPEDFSLDRLFDNLLPYKEVINHNKYANNYDYNRAVYLLNQEKFWDNNFVMLKEDSKLFSPVAVLNFSRYKNVDEVKGFISENEQEIQCVVAKPEIGLNSVNIGETQKPSLNTYADNVDTMEFLSVI